MIDPLVIKTLGEEVRKMIDDDLRREKASAGQVEFPEDRLRLALRGKIRDCLDESARQLNLDLDTDAVGSVGPASETRGGLSILPEVNFTSLIAADSIAKAGLPSLVLVTRKCRIILWDTPTSHVYTIGPYVLDTFVKGQGKMLSLADGDSLSRVETEVLDTEERLSCQRSSISVLLHNFVISSAFRQDYFNLGSSTFSDE